MHYGKGSSRQRQNDAAYSSRVQASNESSRALAARYSLNAKTVRKWRRRTTTVDAPMGLPSATVRPAEIADKHGIRKRMRTFSTCLLMALALTASPMIALAADPISVSAPDLRVGDTWVYDNSFQRGTAGFSQRRDDLIIQRVGSDSMVVGIKPDGAPVNYQDHIVGLDWSQRRTLNGKQTVTTRPFAFPMTVGSTWSADEIVPHPQGLQLSAHFHRIYKAVGWEDVVVPAGKFHAIKVEVNGTAEGQFSASSSAVAGGVAAPASGTTFSHLQSSPAREVHNSTYEELYYAPEVKYFVKQLSEQYGEDGVLTTRQNEVLVSYKVQP